MNTADSYLKSLLRNIKAVREKANISEAMLEERLILGPGWIARFEKGETIPSIDMLLAILQTTNANLSDLLVGLPKSPDVAEVERFIHAKPLESDIVIHFHYSSFDATYTLKNATLAQFEEVIKTLRDGLAGLIQVSDEQGEVGETIKTEAVTRAFLKAVKFWPDANPSDIWWFVIYRAYCDPYNHPARFARLDFAQSWKRTGGWALEKILVEHYAPFLRENGVKLFIATDAKKQALLETIDAGQRLEADKIDVMLTTNDGEFLGVVHVKSSFAERRTDDVPMSNVLKQHGYISPLWTMDCKSTPSSAPKNRGELGKVEGERSAKRKDIEDEGYFTGCFSYNLRTAPSPTTLPLGRRIYVCNFNNPDDTFSRFLLEQRKRGLSGRRLT